MNVVDFGGDPSAVEAAQLQRRQKLAEIMAQQGMDTSPILSPWQGVARIAQAFFGNYDAARAGGEMKALAAKQQAERQAALGQIVDAASNPTGNRAALAKLLVGSKDPALEQAGLGMLLKGPAKLEYHDLGDRIAVTDEGGNVLRTLPKGISPDTKFNKTTVGADTAFTQGEENKRYATPSGSAILSDARTREEGAANRAVTMRGQDLTDARAHETNESAKAPTGYSWNADHTALIPIPGGPAASKPLTEQQANAVGFGMRAKDMNSTLDTMEQGGYVPSFKDIKTAGVPVTNWMASEKGQKYLAAADNFTTAVLRKESGATITPQEQEQARRIYIPMPGDSQQVLAQKRHNRDMAIRALDAQAAGDATTAKAAAAGTGKTVVRTGKFNGRNVIQYSDGSIDYAN